jgi:hypothetical protein
VDGLFYLSWTIDRNLSDETAAWQSKIRGLADKEARDLAAKAGPTVRVPARAAGDGDRLVSSWEL